MMKGEVRADNEKSGSFWLSAAIWMTSLLAHSPKTLSMFSGAPSSTTVVPTFGGVIWRMSVRASVLVILLLVGLTGPAFAQGAGTTVALNGETIEIHRDGEVIAVVESIMLDFHRYSGIRQVDIDEKVARFNLTYEGLDHPSTMNALIDYEVTLEVSAIEGGLRFHTHNDWFRDITIFLRDLGGHMFGVKQALEPYNQKSPDLRGMVQNVDTIGEVNRFLENHATAVSPLYFNSKGYISFFNTFAEGRYLFAMNGVTELYHRSRTFDWYLFFGPTLDQALAGYYGVIGRPKYVPLWACGPVVWRDNHWMGRLDVVQDIAKFSALEMPITAMFVDRPYSTGSYGWSDMNFNLLFFNPEGWIETLNNDFNVKVMTWIAPMTFGDRDFPGLLSGRKGYMDLTDERAVREFQRRLNAYQYAKGVQGHKMDRADENFPYNERWKDGTPIEERRSKYIWLYSKITDEFLREAWGQDQFNFARAAVHGTQPYLSAVWGGDVRTSWDGLASNIANAIRASFQGFPNWGTDAGGYKGTSGFIEADLYLRWVQFAAWTGLFEIKLDGAGGRGEDRVPWKYSKAFQEDFRSALNGRMELLPYIYSQLNTAASTGTLMKPLAGRYPDDPETYDIWDEYLFGDSFLVGPVYTKDPSRSVYLPEGTWTNYHTEQRHQGRQWIDVALTNDHLPVFVKDNSIVVRGNIYEGNDKLWLSAGQYLDVLNYLNFDAPASSVFTLVDGQDQTTKNIEFTFDGGSISVSLPALSYTGTVKVNAPREPTSMMVNGAKQAYTLADGWLGIPYEKGQAAVITIEF